MYSSQKLSQIVVYSGYLCHIALAMSIKTLVHVCQILASSDSDQGSILDDYQTTLGRTLILNYSQLHKIYKNLYKIISFKIDNGKPSC